jgi:hypothetical protein
MNDNLYYINNSNNFSSILSQFGEFLEDDYERLINNSNIPHYFTPHDNKTHRKIVIVGSDGTPLISSKTIFLALQLSGADTIDIKPSALDEALIIGNIIKNNNIYEIKTGVHVGTDQEVELSSSWRNIINDATDIIVFGNFETVEYYKTLATEYRRIHIHEDKVSLGIVNSNSVTDILIDNMCYDFFNFYGCSSLSPKFYIFIGEPDPDILTKIGNVYSLVYGEEIEEFRSKLNFVQQSSLVRFITQEKISRYLHVIRGINGFQINNLYGDVRIYIAKSIKEANEIINMLKNDISTIAVDPCDTEIVPMVEFNMPSRMCNIGSMHSLDFWDSVDEQSDFDIFNEK